MICINCNCKLKDFHTMRIVRLSLTIEEFIICGDCVAKIPKVNVKKQYINKIDQSVRLYEPVLLLGSIYCNANTNFYYAIKPKQFSKYVSQGANFIKTSIQDSYDQFFAKFVF